jgi:hypothetical protein
MSFNSQPAQGYFLDFVESAKVLTAPHIFCGTHAVEGAHCANCRKPLLRLLALSTEDTRLELTGSPFDLLSLFFCWTCNVAQEPFSYHQVTDTSIRLLRYGRDGVTIDFPYARYPKAFPARHFRLQPIAEADTAAIRAWYANNSLNDPEEAHQIGGLPFLWQYEPDAEVSCPNCDQSMAFLATVSDDAGNNKSITGNCSTQHIFHYCRKCRVVSAYQTCD